VAGRFVIRLDFLPAGSPFAHYYMLQVRSRDRLLGGEGVEWTRVGDPERATRFATREGAEAAALMLAVEGVPKNLAYSVVEWNGDRSVRP
jgi:hypothetical protein